MEKAIMENKFKSEIHTLESLADSKFCIPSYQRPYVWETEQIRKLLSDFYGAFSRKDEHKKHYYVGTVLLCERKEAKKVYDVIDGQQRFTTLWLIAVSFKTLNIGSKIENFLKLNNDLRLDFAIRKQIKDYMNALFENFESRKYSDDEIEKDEYLKHITKAVATIKGIIDTYEKNTLKEFGDYIYEKIYFVSNFIPENTDLNKLFETINNSGKQLEQSDILKASLLKNITSEKRLYSNIWEACETMNDFFERNVKRVFPESFREKYTEYDNLKEPPVSSNTEKEQDKVSMKIADILDDNPSENEKKETPQEEPNEGSIDRCRSIITFPQLLIHTYRIFLHSKFLHSKKKKDIERPFHSNNLIAIFKSLTEEEEEQIKEFFKYLWKVRWIFDKEVVKWIPKADGEREEELLLSNIYYETKSFSRSNKEKNDISMLQSMMYYTGDYNTQIWLTPYLKLLLDEVLLDEEKSLTYLESIDNKLSSRQSSKTEKETSFALMNKEDDSVYEFDEDYLKKCRGTSFNHYWFYKLEYILWKELKENERYKLDEKFERYKITSKNSVEHINPQNPEPGHLEIGKKFLDDFGNLALLNVSQNSSYSNMPYKVKKAKFLEKPVFESLKLALIYENEQFDEEKIEKHRDDMIEKIKRHYE
jgi:uncharacterized protein with ParB-like and HNH nuclease domain